ncbi:MAG: indolepyruvate oxidoreductase subunit beta [Anaerolineae bacterium]|nr:indolepyruvate oxidoreductase subunit beta [Anaerolineae bacterium]
MTETFNLMFAGVGGQGSLLIAELTSIAAVQAGYDVKQTEVHGVSQRGGSVETHVRFGEKIYSPVVSPGEADVLVSLEKLESLRFAHFIKPGTGKIIANDFEIVPGSVSNAEQTYPHNAHEYLKGRGLEIITIPATQLARELGDARMANVVLLGALSAALPIPQENWHKALQVRLPKRYLDGNLKAFAAGKENMKVDTPL